MQIIHEDFDHVLTTTRTVRRRLDLDRPVDRTVVEACLELALQAPNGGNRQDWRFILVDDPALKEAVAEHYRAAFFAQYGDMRVEGSCGPGRAAGEMSRTLQSGQHLAENFHRVPVMLIGTRRSPVPQARSTQSGYWGSILPALWSFMLAARSRGLVTAMTARGLDREAEIAAVLGIPYPEVAQTGIIAVGHPDDQRFKPAARQPLSEVTSWNGWVAPGPP